MRCENTPWSSTSQEYLAINSIQLDRPTYKDDVLFQSCKHILTQKHKFDNWLTRGDSLITANCLIILCNRLIMMLRRQIEHLLETFKAEGGFTEGLTAERLAYRSQQSTQSGAPKCPLCGKPMIKRVAKKGINSGKEFWSCSNYPTCNGTLNI
jgi:four helix bundle suffix protein